MGSCRTTRSRDALRNQPFPAAAASTTGPKGVHASAETRFERGDERAVVERSPDSLMSPRGIDLVRSGLDGQKRRPVADRVQQGRTVTSPSPRAARCARQTCHTTGIGRPRQSCMESAACPGESHLYFAHPALRGGVSAGAPASQAGLCAPSRSREAGMIEDVPLSVRRAAADRDGGRRLSDRVPRVARLHVGRADRRVGDHQRNRRHAWLDRGDARGRPSPPAAGAPGGGLTRSLRPTVRQLRLQGDGRVTPRPARFYRSTRNVTAVV